MSRREDILSCIDVTTMDRSAHTAPPSPYSKTFPASRAGAAVTHAAGPGGKRFIDFIEPHACVSALVPKHGSKRTATSRVFLSDLLHRLHGQIQGALPARGAFQKRPEIDAGQEAPFALEHLDRQSVSIVAERIDLAGQPRQPRRRFVLDPQARDPDGGRSRASVHISSLAVSTPQNTGKTALNTQKCMSLSLAGPKAGVSREELR